MEANKVKAKPLVISFAALTAIEWLVHSLASDHGTGRWLMMGLMRLAQIAVLVTVIRAWGGGLSALGLQRQRVPSGLKRGLFWSMGFGSIALVAFSLLLPFGFDPLIFFRTPLPDRLLPLCLFLFVGGIIGPFAEELFFRGLLYGFLRRWGITAAVLLSTLAFVSAHGTGNRIPVAQTVGGILFALSYEFEGNLMVPITLHILGNMALFGLAMTLPHFFG